MGEKLARSIEGNWLKNRGQPLDLDAAQPASRSARHDPEIGVREGGDEDVAIPQFDTGGKMGHGFELRDQPGVIQSWRVSPEWIEKNVRAYSAKKNLCIVTGFGDSMQPMFSPGDPLLVDVGIRIVDFDAIYFFRVKNEGFVKRLQRIPTEHGLIIRAMSANKDYQPWDITEKMDFEVLGRVLKVWCSRDF